MGNGALSSREHLKKSVKAIIRGLLVHYGPEKGLVVLSDASPYCVEVVLPHVVVDDSEQPVAQTSRGLST